VEGDFFTESETLKFIISIHTLRVEGDVAKKYNRIRGEISIHTLRVEGDAILQHCRRTIYISIHTLRVEGDSNIGIMGYTVEKFQSTPSGWRVTDLHQARFNC